MKIIPNRTLYRCDHCTAYRLSADAAEYHERFCKRNPDNQHKCFGCQHLVVAAGIAPDGRALKSFTCEALNRPLYSYVAEKRGLLFSGLLPESSVRMPLVCPTYQINLIDEPTNTPF